MEQSINKLKKLFTFTPQLPENYCTEPQIGFKVIFCDESRQLRVKVIGARQLPTLYGNIKPYGYLVKIRVFPEKDKFETGMVQESWPTFNEEFTFTLHNPPNSDCIFKGKFISFTVYSILENDQDSKDIKKGILKRFLSFSEYGENSHIDKKRQKSHRYSLNSRRTIGASTFNLDRKFFTQTSGSNCICTPDIWRAIKEINSGMSTEPREGRKGTLEVTLSYALSDDGANNIVEISVTRLRCNIQTMQQHEKLAGQLYIKITAFEQEDLVQKMKSDRFMPTISLKIEPKTATLRVIVNNYNKETVKILIRLMCKNRIGKKILLGKIEIDSKSDIWNEIIQSPNNPITKMINLE